MPYLHITDKEGKRTSFPLDKDEVTIGRVEGRDIVLQDGIVSRLHAKILTRSGDHWVVDQGSYNGTRVNGNIVTETRLKEGDTIGIGKAVLVFSRDERPAPTSPPARDPATREMGRAWQQQVVSSVSKAQACADSASLLATLVPAQRASRQEIRSLERTNKALFVLYEVSRQLNSLMEFEELLEKVMDLILKVVEADYGFLFLLGEGGPEDLRPVVVKAKTGQAGDAADMMASRTIINRVIQDKVALLTSDAMDDSRLAMAESIVFKKIHSAMCVPLMDREKIIGIIQLTSISLTNLYTKNDLELLKTIGCQMAMVIGQARLNRQIREEEEMRRRLERFHSPQVIEMILQEKGGPEDLMEPKEVDATILFTDIAGFTPLAEKLPAREVTLILNQHFSRMTDIIFEHGGTLDKYIGDGLMAVFGAPMGAEDDAARAVRAALRMKTDFLKRRELQDEALRFDMRMGINSGRVVAGNIGSPRRMDYTVIGDPVNIAARLETAAGSNQILIGEETYRLVKSQFKIRKVGPLKLKGKSMEIMAYEVLGE
jgi:adenylate cyclase